MPIKSPVNLVTLDGSANLYSFVAVNVDLQQHFAIIGLQSLEIALVHLVS